MKRNILTIIGIALIAALGYMFIQSTAVYSHHITSLPEAVTEIQPLREEAMAAFVELTESDQDAMALQRLEERLEDALTVLDSWHVDNCWLPWYAIQRAEFELLAEAIRLSRLGAPPVVTGALVVSATNLTSLNNYNLARSLERCITDNREV